MKNSFCLLTVVVVLLFVAGCGGDDYSQLPDTVEASGVVLLDGKPVKGASVVFAPTPPNTYPAVAGTDQDGNFSLRLAQGKPGAVPGAYKVQVSKTVEVEGAVDTGGEPAEGGDVPEEAGGAGWKNDLPQKYASTQTSEIEIEVPESGVTDIRLELKSSP